MSNRRGGGDDPIRSGAGWSAASPSDAPRDDGEHAFAVPADQRYADLEPVATGGMGTVTVARDHRLGREVALKRVAVESADPAAAVRLAREAEITARLEHPNIVAIYDAGVGADGELYYAMRLIRGRSLAEAIVEARTSKNGARAALLRHFLDVCHAIAYAHGRGIVHRDLKPANIMVGEFGETQVVDWGLAQDLAEEHEATGVSGTPAYLAPECARGERGSRAADVWSLGAILYELVADRRLREGDKDAVLAAARGSKAPAIAWPDGVAAELRAVIDKATAWDAAKRYADAGELAHDVAAYLDGKRVGAHVYSSFELARRLIHAWRLPLALIGTATVVGAVVLATMWRRVETQRENAQSALSWALDATAVSTLASGAPAEAEVIAAHALKAGESSEARGVLAAVRAGARPAAVERVDLPGCGSLVVDDEQHALCLSRDRVARWSLASRSAEWSVPLLAQSALAGAGWIAIVDANQAVVVLDAATGSERMRVGLERSHATLVRDVSGASLVVQDGRSLIVIDPAAGQAYQVGRVCGNETLDAVALGRTDVFAVCATGQVVHAGRDRVGRPPTEMAPELTRVPFGVTAGKGAHKPASVVALDAEERRLVIGGIGGEIQIVALVEGAAAVSPQRVLDHAIARVAFHGEHVVVGGEHGATRVWTGTLTSELFALPAHASTGFVVRGDSLLSSSGAAWWRWTLPTEIGPRVFMSDAGLSGAAVTDDGAWVAAARGDGIVEAWSVRTGARSAQTSLANAVIKRVDYSADGSLLAAGIATAGISSAVLDTKTWQSAPHRAAVRGVSRIAYLDGDDLIGVHYGADLTRWSRNGEASSIASPVYVDAARTADRSALWMVTEDGTVARLRAGSTTIETVLVDPGVSAVAPADGDRGLLLLHPTQVALLAQSTVTPVALHAHSAVTAISLPGGDAPSSIALSADAAWAAIGTYGGVIHIWSARTQRVVAILRGHRERVAWIVFAAGALWSASWDGSIRKWSLDALELPAAELIEDAERTWRMNLDDALRR